jgi:hypothetical protein
MTDAADTMAHTHMRDTLRCNGDWTTTPAYAGLLRVDNGNGKCGFSPQVCGTRFTWWLVRMPPTSPTLCVILGERYPVPISAIASRGPFFRAQCK